MELMTMPALFITEDHVRELLDMPTAIEVVEELFRQLADGRAKNVPRSRVLGGKMMLHTMSGVCEYLQIGGWKAYTTTREKSRFHVGLYDLATGETLAIIEADTLGQLRTGAASGVATPNPDNTVTVGLTIVNAQGSAPAHVAARSRRNAHCGFG